MDLDLKKRLSVSLEGVEKPKVNGIGKLRADKKLDFNNKVISFDDHFDKPEPYLLINDRPFLVKGGLTTIKGQPKAGKSTACKLVVASLLSGEEIIATPTTPKTVLWIDTEQSKYYVKKTYTDLNKLGVTPDVLRTNFNMLSLAGESIEDSLKYIEMSVDQIKPDVLVVDQIADLVPESNNQEESNNVLRLFAKIMNQTDTAIISLIHTNKGNDLSTGHLGSAVEKKSSVISIVKDSNEIKTLSCDRSREAPFAQTSFRYDDKGNIVKADVSKKDSNNWDEELKSMLLTKCRVKFKNADVSVSEIGKHINQLLLLDDRPEMVDKTLSRKINTEFIIPKYLIKLDPNNKQGKCRFT